MKTFLLDFSIMYSISENWDQFNQLLIFTIFIILHFKLKDILQIVCKIIF